MITQIAHVCLQTPKLKETVAFYKSVLGLKVLFRFLRKGRVFGYYLACGKKTFIEVFENKRLKAGEGASISHLCLEVADIKAAAKRLDKKKVPHSEPQFGCDNSWQLWIKDPNEIQIEFHEYTKKSSQAIGKDCIATW
jgi:glyoxylase I family protein